jgi:hypothetical protein
MNNEQKILDNAPEGATHVDRANHYWKFLDEFGDFLMCDREDGWVGGFSPIVIRSLADIKRIAELEKELDDLLSLSAMSDLKKSLAIRDVEQQKRVVQILWDAGKCDADSWGYILEALKESK